MSEILSKVDKAIHLTEVMGKHIKCLLDENEALRAKVDYYEQLPTIVCLCGSTRFMDAFFEAGWAETLAGKIVLSVGVCKHAEADADGGHGAEMLGPEVVARLDELHLRKIDLADEVFILNVGGYIGESTGNELRYARSKGKTIRFLEPEIAPAKPEGGGPARHSAEHGGGG